MELIRPDGSKSEIKPEAAAIGPHPELEEKVVAFRADFNTPGLMKLEVNVEALSHSMEGQFQFMGFMDHHKGKVLQIIGQIVRQREAMKAEIQKENNKGLFRGFLGKKR